jgi:hypothetical protein
VIARIVGSLSPKSAKLIVGVLVTLSFPLSGCIFSISGWDAGWAIRPAVPPIQPNIAEQHGSYLNGKQEAQELILRYINHYDAQRRFARCSIRFVSSAALSTNHACQLQAYYTAFWRFLHIQVQCWRRSRQRGAKAGVGRSPTNSDATLKVA